MPKGVVTYGRRCQQRKIVVDDPWNKVVKKSSSSSSSGHLFSSEIDSSLASNISIENTINHSTRIKKYSSRNTKKKSCNDENVETKGSRRGVYKKDKSTKLYDSNSSAENKSVADGSRKSTKQAFKDRSNVQEKNRPTQKKINSQARVTRSAIKGKTTKKMTKKKVQENEAHQNHALNFSEFDDYSLVLDSSPSYVAMLHSPVLDLPPSITTRGQHSVNTSTPHKNRTYNKPTELTHLEKSNFSHIVSHDGLKTPYLDVSKSVCQNDMDSICQELDSLQMSALSSIAHSPVIKHRITKEIESTFDESVSLPGKSHGGINLSSIPSHSLLVDSPQPSVDPVGGGDHNDSVEPFSALTDKLQKLHSNLQHAQQYSDTNFSRTPIRECNVDLTKLSDSMISFYTEKHVSMRSKRGTSQSEQSYNASQSLFDDEQSEYRSLRNRNIELKKDSRQDSSVESDMSENEDQEDLSYIKEESEGEKSSSEISDVSDKSEEESEEDESITTSEEELDTEEKDEEDSNVTRYMLANSQSSVSVSQEEMPSLISEAQSLGGPEDSLYDSESSSINCVVTPVKQTKNLLHTPSQLLHSHLKKRHKQLSLVANELEDMCNSFVVLSPVRIRKSDRVITPMEKVLMQCNQKEPGSFYDCITPAMMKKCVKIGEGVFGEVFRSERNKSSVALKVIPIEGDFEVNDEKQKSLEEILPEILISKELSRLSEDGENQTSNFVRVLSVSLVQGKYPDTLLKQWDIFHKKKVSENDRPDIFDDNQFFIVFEFEDSGCDLEGFKFQSMEEARSVLHQVTCALAIGETALEFEHRDLHWGNVLVKRIDQENLHYRLNNKDYNIETCGVKVAIIDFTLSRLRKDGCSVFCDLSMDPTLFEGYGDYQFDVYRLMREQNGNEWESHHPQSNVLWIHYLADKLLKGKAYPKDGAKALSRQLRTFTREVTHYNSAKQLLTQSPIFDY